MSDPAPTIVATTAGQLADSAIEALARLLVDVALEEAERQAGGPTR